MQQKNFWLFLLISMSILLVWSWVQIQFAPEPKKPEDKQQQAKSEKKKDESKKDSKKEDGKKKKEPKVIPPKVEPISEKEAKDLSQTVARVITAPIYANPAPANFAALLSIAATAEEATKQAIEVALTPPKKTPEIEKVETTAIGDDTFFLKAILTTRGAGVQRLTLTEFQAASWEGLPVTNSQGEPMKLDLIPEDPIRPSFLMFHYADPDPSNPDQSRPDTTLGDRIWRLEKSEKDKDKHVVTFVTEGPAGYEYLLIRKIYTLESKSYHLGLKIVIEDTGKDAPEDGKRAPFRYQLAGAHGLPIEGGWYTYTHRNAMIGMVDSRDVLWRTMEPAAQISFRKGGDRVPGGNRGEDMVQYAGVTTQYFASMIAVDNEQQKDVKQRDILAYARPTLESQEKKCFVDDISIKQRQAKVRIRDNNRIMTVMVQLLPRAVKDLEDLKLQPNESTIINLYEVYQNGETLLVANGFRRGEEIKPYLEDITVRVVSDKVEIAPKESVVHQFVLYHGPVKIRQLGFLGGAKEVNPELVTRYADTLHLATLTDYPTVTWLSWWSDLLIFCTKVMHRLLHWLYLLVPVEGLTIILLTVIVRGLMFPISRKQAMTTMRMQALQPEMKKIQEKYKTDMQAKQQAMMELYRKHKVNPFGGCLPLFIQLPIFLGLFYALQESIRFRLAPFLWIENLAAPDMLFYWGQSIPWITSPDSQGGFLYLGPYFNLLPILAVSIMLVHQKMVMPPAVDEQQQMQQKMMTYMMFVIGIMFYKVAAGLCIYFTASTLWGVLERKFLPKKQAGPTTTAESAGPSTSTAGKSGGKDGKAKLTPAQRRKERGKKKKEEPNTAAKKVKSWWEEVLKQAKKK